MSFLAAPGVLQLTERCRVYDRQYIKCIIGAPIIAKAIQNGYPPNFKFKEMNHPYVINNKLKKYLILIFLVLIVLLIYNHMNF